MKGESFNRPPDRCSSRVSRRERASPSNSPVTRLSNIATIKPETSYQSVSHYTVQRVLDIAANIDGRDLGGVVSDIKRKIDAITAEKDFPPTTRGRCAISGAARSTRPPC